MPRRSVLDGIVPDTIDAIRDRFNALIKRLAFRMSLSTLRNLYATGSNYEAESLNRELRLEYPSRWREIANAADAGKYEFRNPKPQSKETHNEVMTWSDFLSPIVWAFITAGCVWLYSTHLLFRFQITTALVLSRQQIPTDINQLFLIPGEVLIPFVYGIYKIRAIYYRELHPGNRQLAFFVAVVGFPLYMLLVFAVAENGANYLGTRVAAVFWYLNIVIFVRRISSFFVLMYRKFMMVPSVSKIRVRLANGRTGLIDPNDFDPLTMRRI